MLRCLPADRVRHPNGQEVFVGVMQIVWMIVVGFIVGVLENGIVLLGINTYAQQVVTGAAILLAVGVDIWQKRRERRLP